MTNEFFVFCFFLSQMWVVLAKQFILVKITKITIYLWLYLHSLKTKPPNLTVRMSMFIFLEASFWPRFSLWDILGKVRKTVIVILYASIFLFNISVPQFALPVRHSYVLSQKSQIPGPLYSVTISTLSFAKVWAQNKLECYGFQWYFHWTNNQKLKRKIQWEDFKEYDFLGGKGITFLSSSNYINIFL